MSKKNDIQSVTISGNIIGSSYCVGNGDPNQCIMPTHDCWKWMCDNRWVKSPIFSGCFEVVEGNKLKTVHIKRVLYNDPVVVVWWSDGTVTRTKVRGEDEYSPEVGLMYCILKKLAPNQSLDTLSSEWLPEQLPIEYKMQYVDIKDVKAKHKKNS